MKELRIPGEIGDQKSSELRLLHQRHRDHCPKYKKPYQMAAQNQMLNNQHTQIGEDEGMNTYKRE